MPKLPQAAIPGSAGVPTELPRTEVAEFVLGAAAGSVLALGGIDGEGLRVIVDAVESDRCDRRALFMPIEPAATAELIVEQALDRLAETTLRLWPVWFTDVSFGACGDDRLGRLAVGAIARHAAYGIAGLSPAWAEAAARLALAHRPPRVRGALPAVELAQLTRAVSCTGLVLVVDMGRAGAAPNPAAVVHALEWIARHSRSAVIALFAELPPHEPPFERILYGARRVMAAGREDYGFIGPDAAAIADAAPWMAPWRGLPHPLSEIEQRLAKALGADAELAPLFGFNQLIETIRGSRPKVDLVWREGRLVVEIDGYGSHGNRIAFIYDRHRDYELTLSGYTVLRLANDEVAQDCEKAIEKIRDLVRLRRIRPMLEE